MFGKYARHSLIFERQMPTGSTYLVAALAEPVATRLQQTSLQTLYDVRAQVNTSDCRRGAYTSWSAVARLPASLLRWHVAYSSMQQGEIERASLHE